MAHGTRCTAGSAPDYRFSRLRPGALSGRFRASRRAAGDENHAWTTPCTGSDCFPPRRDNCSNCNFAPPGIWAAGYLSPRHLPTHPGRSRNKTPLVWRLAIGWCFVAPKTAWGKARRGSIAAALCDRGATKPQAVFGATLRAAVLFACRFVPRSSQTAEGYARRSRLAGNENSLRRNTSQLRDTTLGVPKET